MENLAIWTPFLITTITFLEESICRTFNAWYIRVHNLDISKRNSTTWSAVISPLRVNEKLASMNLMECFFYSKSFYHYVIVLLKVYNHGWEFTFSGVAGSSVIDGGAGGGLAFSSFSASFSSGSFSFISGLMSLKGHRGHYRSCTHHSLRIHINTYCNGKINRQ